MKLHILTISLCCTLSFIFISCEKEQQSKTSVSGVVSNKLTGKFIRDIPIEIIECDGIPQKCLNTIQTVYTDTKGYYNASFTSEKRKAYEIAIGLNNVISSTPYPYYYPITNGISNTINFSKLPLGQLILKIKILRHDKNWFVISVNNTDLNESFSYDFYNGLNPAIDFENTYSIKIEVGRPYAVVVLFCNKTGQSTFSDNEWVQKDFVVNSSDTTRVDFVIP